jgi:GNAT superfamily N-acetyltransferase
MYAVLHRKAKGRRSNAVDDRQARIMTELPHDGSIGGATGNGHLNERTLRRAKPDEAQILTELTFRSKRHWGYDDAFMLLYRDALTVTPEQIGDSPVYLLEAGGRICGYYALQHSDEQTVVLDGLFTEPDAMRSGVGAALWHHALETAAALGCSSMVLESDPHAEGFYVKMGASRIGEKPAPIPGQPERVLPKMRIDLSQRSSG